jgi:hypothetical protein
MANLRRLRERVKSVLHEAGVDLGSQVFCSNDPVIAHQVMPRLNRSDENPLPGVTKYVLPFGMGSKLGMLNEIVLEPNAGVPWHCHPSVTVRHTVIQGHVILERLVKRNGKPVPGPKGLLREHKRLDVGDFWRAPPGEPYAYRAEDEPARTRYDHEEDPIHQPVQQCLDPSAKPEIDEPDPENSLPLGRRMPRGGQKRRKPSRGKAQPAPRRKKGQRRPRGKKRKGARKSRGRSRR